MIGWRVSLQGRIKPYVLPPKTYIAEDVRIEQMLEGRYMPQIQHANGGRPYVFAQDRAPAHYASKTVQWLNKNARGRLEERPAKGADMMPLDYSLWSQVQERAWADKCCTLLQLKASVHKHISEIPTSVIADAINAFEKRVRACLDAKGETFEHKLQKSRKKKVEIERAGDA